MSGKGPMEMLEEVKGDEEAPGVVFERVCEGETLREIAKSWGCAVGRFVEWFAMEHAELYDAALKVRADELAHGALSDAAGATGATVSADRLRVETKLRVAGKWDRARYGEQVRVEREVRFSVEEELVGLASALLGVGRSRLIEDKELVLKEELKEDETPGHETPGQAGATSSIAAPGSAPFPLGEPVPVPVAAMRRRGEGLI